MVCDYLSISKDKLRELICSNTIRPVTMPGGKDLMFRRYDLDKFVTSLEEVKGAEAILARREQTEKAAWARAEKRTRKTVVSQVEHGLVEGSVGAVG